MNARTQEPERCFEGARSRDVVTVLSSGNAVFCMRETAEPVMERRFEAGMQADFGKAFPTIVRRIDALQAMLDADPFPAFRLATGSKRVVTFLRSTAAPIAADSTRRCLPGADGPAFMRLLEKAFGKDITSRTWDTIARTAVR